MLHVDAMFDDFVQFMFLKNHNDVKICLELEGVDTVQDLFAFCLDILYKGLVIIAGNGVDRVDLDSVTREQFDRVCDRMLLAGIQVHLCTYGDQLPHDNTGVMFIENKDGRGDLIDHVAQIRTQRNLFFISFSLQRV